MTLMERISQDMTAAMRAREAQRLGALRMAKAALMNREVEKGRALDEGEEQQVIVVADQTAARLDRAVPAGRPRGSRRQGGGRNHHARSLSTATGGSGRDRARRQRGHRGNGRDVGEGPGQGDEGRHAEAGRPGRRRQDHQRTGPPEARCVKTPNLSRSIARLITLKGTHKPLIHPPLGSCRQGRSLFFAHDIPTFRTPAVRIRSRIRTNSTGGSLPEQSGADPLWYAERLMSTRVSPSRRPHSFFTCLR